MIYRRDFLKMMGLGVAAMVLPRPNPTPGPSPFGYKWGGEMRGEMRAGEMPMRVPYGIAAEAARMKIYLPVVRR